MWNRCGRKRGNFAAAQNREKLLAYTSRSRTRCASGYAVGKPMICFGKQQLSTETDAPC
jgi:hypothetical protein